MRNAVTEQEQEQGQEKVVIELNATDLAWLAETADGTRVKEFTLVRDKDGKAALRTELQSGDKAVTGVKVRTEPSLQKPGAKRIPVLEVTLRPEACQPIGLKTDDGADAVFWTDSAIEKFLYPYYHAQRLWDEDLSRLEQAFRRDERAVAILHKAPSTSFSMGGRAGEALAIGRVLPGPSASATLRWEPLEDYLRSRPS